MRNKVQAVLAALAFSAGLAAQVKITVGPPPPAKPARPIARPWGIGRWWGAYPFGWWGLREERPLPPPVTPEPEAPRWVVNRDYQPERLQPAVREFAEGQLRPANPSAPVLDGPPCDIQLAGGAVVRAVSCAEVDDMVIYRTADGRRTRASLDLAWVKR